MKILSIECNMGAAGDMLAAALYELLSPEEKVNFLADFQALSLPGIRLDPVVSQKCGIFGTHMNVFYHDTEEDNPAHHHHSHQHFSYQDMIHLINHLPLPEQIKQNSSSIFEHIAIAEGQVHQTTIEQIHFHEIGTMDAIADVVACCMLFDRLAVAKIYCTPIHTGFGFVQCAHGILPVPAPATALILSGIPTIAGQIEGELCTPTGAAILRHFVDEFSTHPLMTTEKIGYGMGKKDFPAANCVRIFLGNIQDKLSSSITKLECNVDDMIGEDLGYAMEQLFFKGALDVFFTSVQMKKNRPGHLITCLCKNEDKDSFIKLLFLHTTTRGIRIHQIQRAVMHDHVDLLETPDGTIHLKCNSYENIHRSKIEYEDLKEIALRNGESLDSLRKRLLHTF